MKPQKTIGLKYRRRALYFCAWLMSMSIGLVLFALPLFLVQKIQTSVFIVGLTGSLGALSYSLFCLGTGRLSDRLGRKRIMIMGTALFVCAYFLITQTYNIFYVWGLVILGGIGLSMFWPPLAAWVAESAPKKHLIKTLGTYNIAWSVGGMLGPLLGGFLFPLGYRRPFYFACGFGIILFFLITKLSEGDKKKILESPEAPGTKGTTEKTVFLFIAWIANFGSWFVIVMMGNMFPVLALTLKIRPMSLGFLLFLVGFSQTCMYFFLRKWPGWHYRLIPLLFCQTLTAGGLLIGFFTNSVALFAISFIMIGISAGMTYFSSIFYSLDSPLTRGRKTGFHESVLGTGALLGPLFGGLAARYYDLRAPYLLGLTLIICAMLLEIAIYRNTVNGQAQTGKRPS